MSVSPRAEKFNIVSDDHGPTHKCNFSVFDQKFSYWANLVKKIQNCQFKLKFDAWNISHKLLRTSQFLEKFMEILEWSSLQIKSGPFPLLNVAAYWKSSSSEACAKKPSQILTNNIDNGEEGLVSEFM